MALWVQKFGGSSLANLECVRKVAAIIQHTKSLGHDVVVVVSAMGEDTDYLARLATQIMSQPAAREWDALLASAENKSAALLSLALQSIATPACSLSAHQINILTTDHHQKADLLSVDTNKISQLCQQGIVPIITGFQGVNEKGDVTTLGRGGSDITAVALAGFLSADECQIYTDVKGIYTTDPRIVPQARLLERITFSEMLVLSGLGAQVLQRRAAEFACCYHVPVRVLSTFESGPGTLLYEPLQHGNTTLVSGIAFDQNIVQITVTNVPHEKKFVEDLLAGFNQCLITVDMMICACRIDKKKDVHFTVKSADSLTACKITQDMLVDSSVQEVIINQRMAKLSLVGLGMSKHAAVSARVLQVLADEGMAVQLITSSELQVSIVIDKGCLELAARLLHSAFELQSTEELSFTTC